MPTMPFETPLTPAPFQHLHLHLPTFTTSLNPLPIPLKLKAQNDFITHLLVHIILLRTELSVRMGRCTAERGEDGRSRMGECNECNDERRRDEDGRRVVEACEVLVHALEGLKGQVLERWEGVAGRGVGERTAVLEGLWVGWEEILRVEGRV